MRIFLLKKAKAFSLIELIISLIIISLLVGAFAPLITKKLKAGDVTVGSFSNGTKRNVTKEDCDKLNAVFIEASKNDGVKPVCVTKYNVGDNVGSGGVPIAGDVQKLNVNEICTDSGNCCWKGPTSDNCTNDETYSGCTRTVCNWKAANTSCNSYAPIGTTPGMWRLPNEEEMKGWAGNIVALNTGEEGQTLQLCGFETSSANTIECSFGDGKCNGADLNICYPYHYWSLTKTNEGKYYDYSIYTV